MREMSRPVLLLALLSAAPVLVAGLLLQRASPKEFTSFEQSAGSSRNCWGPPQGETLDADYLEKFSQEHYDQADIHTWVSILPERRREDSGNGRPKLGVLMFITDEVFNEHMWTSWIDEAIHDDEPFQLLIHASGVAPNATLKQPYFEKYFAHEQAPTKFCDIFDAELLMMKKALEDTSITHLATVSADSVPLQSLRYIHGKLRENQATRMCMDTTWANPRAETWWAMRRSDAELFVENQAIVGHIFKRGCTEENSFAFPLVMRMHQWGEDAEFLNECVMFTDWSNSCKDWRHHSDNSDCTELRESPHNNASGVHPRTYFQVTPKAWKELRNSSFWFGRKFARDAFVLVPDPWTASEGVK